MDVWKTRKWNYVTGPKGPKPAGVRVVWGVRGWGSGVGGFGESRGLGVRAAGLEVGAQRAPRLLIHADFSQNRKQQFCMITKYPFQTFIEVSAISIIQSMPGARGRPKRPTWSHFQTIEGGLWVHAMFYHYSQFVQVIFQCQKFLFYESILWNRIQEYI